MYKLTGTQWKWLLPVVHLYQFSPRSLQTIFEENGFKLISITSDDDISEFTYNVLDKYVSRKTIFHKVLYKIGRVILLFAMKTSDIWGKSLKGGRLIAIFQKI
jgi:hypothetical protein